MTLSIQTAFHGQLGVPFRIELWCREGERGHVVVVRVEGPYWLEGRREGGGFICMVVAAALANPHGPGIGLVCDVSGVDYTGGDRLLEWRDLRALREREPYPLAVVSSASNRRAVQSLLVDNDDEELLASHFASVEDAVSVVLERARAAGEALRLRAP